MLRKQEKVCVTRFWSLKANVLVTEYEKLVTLYLQHDDLLSVCGHFLFVYFDGTARGLSDFHDLRAAFADHETDLVLRHRVLLEQLSVDLEDAKKEQVQLFLSQYNLTSAL